jgi:hypothetical protein
LLLGLLVGLFLAFFLSIYTLHSAHIVKRLPLPLVPKASRCKISRHLWHLWELLHVPTVQLLSPEQGAYGGR